MTQLTQAELAKELDSRPATAKGWNWTWQRCGRHQYRKCVVHLTNSGQLVPSAPAQTDVPPLRISGRYAAGRP